MVGLARRLLSVCRLMLIVLLGPLTSVFAQEPRVPPASPPTPEPAHRSPLLFVDNERFRIEGRVDLSVGAFSYRGTFFNLPPPGSLDYNSRRRWIDGGLEPGVDITFRPFRRLEVYGGISLGLSGTWGTDAYDVTNEGHISLENRFVGVRTTNPETSWNFDLSVGQQDYVAGTGMLVALGADNGFEVGGLNLLPRSAWSNAAIARFSYNGLHLEGFYLDPNSLDSLDTGERLAGGDAEYRWGEESRVGLSYVHVLESRFAYPLPNTSAFIESGRNGLGSIDCFAELDGSALGVSNAWIKGEFVLQRNSRIDMKAHAFYGGVGYSFPRIGMSPKVSLEYAAFSADDPTTSQYERFDPLFYGGDGSIDWYFGANSSFAFINSSVNQIRTSLELTASERNTLAFQYVHSRANKLNSPIQFNELDREEIVDGVPTFLTGVKHPHLADEVYGEWKHALTPRTSITFWGSAAFPGRGFRTLPAARTENWLGAGVVLAFKF